MVLRPYFYIFAIISATIFLFDKQLLAQDKWTKVETKNFELIGSASEKEIKNVALMLEQFREVFKNSLGKIKLNPAAPVKVIVFKDEQSFGEFKPLNNEGKRIEWVKGYFQRSNDAGYIVLAAKSNEYETYHTVFHEFVHYLMYNSPAAANFPPWFNEGLAEYYELFRIENEQKVTLGVANESHLRLLRENNLIPFENFFGIDNYTLHLQEKNSVGLFYAQAWALMHYFIQNPERYSQLTKFVDLVSASKPPNSAFQEAFQANYATIETELKSYIGRKSFPVTVEFLKNKIAADTSIQAFPVSEIEAKTILGDLLYQANRFGEAGELLSGIIKISPEAVQAHITLGLVRMKQKNFAEARKHLEKAIGLDKKNFLSYYQLASILSREDMSDFGFVAHYNADLAQKMRGYLKKAIELNPDFAESYHLYAVICIVRNEELDQAEEYLKKAINIQPGNLWFRIRQAEILWRRNEFSKAREIALKAFQNADDDKTRLYAQNTLGIINALEAQAKEANSRREDGDEFNKIYTEEELAYLRKIGILKSITASLRNPKSEEVRVLGSLRKIECGASGVEYFLKVNNQSLILNSKNFELLRIVSYNPEMANAEVGCNSIRKDVPAVVIYRPFGGGKSSRAGEIVSIEFVPENFEFTY